jgi:hypothetical protein
MLMAFRLVYFALLAYCLLFFAWWTVDLLRQRAPDYSAPRCRSVSGVLSAFTRGMLPWRKESARLYPFAYAGGILYHVATFTSLWVLAFPGLLQKSAFLVPVLLAGLASGLCLLLKRVLSRHSRMLSQFDDYLSNLLVDIVHASVLLAALGLVRAFVPYVATFLVLLYLPFGKLKHCYFFFASRLLLGAAYGRRGVMI